MTRGLTPLSEPGLHCHKDSGLTSRKKSAVCGTLLAKLR